MTRPDGAPIVLLFGASGAGKSSLLAAGLLPRLVASHEVLYLRRDPALGLAGSLARALHDEDWSAAWHQKETPDRPLIVILDQTEEAWTRPLAPGREVQDFAAILRTLFASRESRPRGRLVLGFRKEWLAEVRQLLDDEKLPRALVEILHLDRDGIEEAVRGPASSERLRRQYGLEVAAELPAQIAGDLLEQGTATIAPILQILLSQMWTEARGGIVASPRFTLDLYESLKRRGLLLDDFLDEQLRALGEWRPEAVHSGLALDLLFFHTTDLGTAESRAAAEVAERYGHRPEIPELLGQCKDRYLLAEGGQEGEARESPPSTTRLAHDTLAPLVRRCFESSDLPGQRAQRILLRAEEWTEGRIGEVLGELDLARVEEGRDGMRVRTEDEARLVAASRLQVERRRHQRRLLQITAVAAVAVILGTALLFLWQRQQARASEERARDRAYAALGNNLEADHRTETALVALEIRRPDSTPTADSLLHQALAAGSAQTAILAGHSASFSPDGTRVVTASDKTARIWNAAPGQPIAILKGHTDMVSAASFSPDSTRVVTASWDQTARIWNATTGQPIAILKGHTAAVMAASFSLNGTLVVTASEDKTARIWNAATGQPIATLKGQTAAVDAASLSPDGTKVVTVSRAAIGFAAKVQPGGQERAMARIWNAATGQLIATLTGHTDGVSAACFSPDGTRVVTASGDKTARIWNAATGQPIAILTGHADGVEAASFSPDGTRVVTASRDKTARIWNAATGQPIVTLAGHADAVLAACFSPDGTRVVTASWDQTARIWNAATGQPTNTLAGHTGLVFTASFHPDGIRVVTASDDKTARIWTVAPGQPIATFTGHTAGVYAASFSPDGTRVLTVSKDKAARIWSAETGQPIATLKGHTGLVKAACFSQDGTRVMTEFWDKTRRIWNAATGQPITALTEHTAWVWPASFSPDGTRVVTASWDKTARIWNAVTGQRIATLEGHTDAVFAACFSPDGTRVVTASWDRTARVWDASTDQLIATLTGHSAAVWAASFSPDGTRVVTASMDKTARIWDASTGRPIAILNGHTAAVYAASFSSDGTRVVTASDDKTARIWNAATEYLQGAIRARTRLCLPVPFRRNTLGEDQQEAERQEKACRACVPKFFARVQGVPAGNPQPYIKAWRAYRGCLEDSR